MALQNKQNKQCYQKFCLEKKMTLKLYSYAIIKIDIFY